MSISMTILFSIACFIVGYCAGRGDRMTDDEPDGSKYFPEELKEESDDKLPENLQKYYAALEEGNEKKAAKYLKKNAELCPDRDSDCLNGMFCPECPRTNGGLIVLTDRGQIL